jgi:hypothetical protein
MDVPVRVTDYRAVVAYWVGAYWVVECRVVGYLVLVECRLARRVVEYWVVVE